jgi:ribose transport system substrate-binding protein
MTQKVTSEVLDMTTRKHLSSILSVIALVGAAFALGSCGDDDEESTQALEKGSTRVQQSVDPEFGRKLKCDTSPSPQQVAAYKVPKANEDFDVTLMEVSLAAYYYQGIKVGAEQAADEAGVDLETVAAAGYVSPERQLEQVENAIQKGTDGIVLAPSDFRGSIPVVEAAARADIPVVNISTEIATDVPKVLQDDYVLGQQSADLVAERLGSEGGKGVIIAGPANADWSRKRTAGFKDRVRERYPNIEVVASPTQLVDPKAGLKSFEDAVQANPDIDWIYAVHYFILPPKGIPDRYRGQIPYVGMGYEPDSIDALRDGSIDTVLGIAPIAMGRMGVGELVKLLNGDQIPTVTCVPAPKFTESEIGTPLAEAELIPES